MIQNPVKLLTLGVNSNKFLTVLSVVKTDSAVFLYLYIDNKVYI